MIDSSQSTTEPPLTELQLAYLIGREAPELGGTTCWLCWEFDNPGMDLERLEDAWNALIARHPSLRTVFVGGSMRVLDGLPRYSLEVRDCRDLSDAAAEAAISEVRTELFGARLDPSRWPLFRVCAVLTRSRMRLFVGVEILIADGSSVFLLLNELSQIYGDPSKALPRPPVTFQDYLASRQRQKLSPEYSTAAKYWMSRLSELPPAPELPTTGAAIARAPFRRVSHRIPRESWLELQRRAAERGVRRVPALAAAFSEVLSRWSARRDFCLNVTVGTRKPPEFDRVVGDFSTNLLLAVDCRSQGPFVDRVRKVAEQLSQDLEHVAFGGVEVISALSRRRNERVLMPVVFTSLLHRHANFAPFGRFISGITRTPQVTLDCQLLDADGGDLCLTWDIAVGVYSDQLLSDMFESFTSFVERLASTDAAWDEEWLDLLPEAQRQRRIEANATGRSWAAETLHERVLAQARTTPDATALITPTLEVTYRELVSRSAALAATIARAGATRGQLVAIILPRGDHQVIAALAVELSGAAYLPIDISTPPARIAELLRLGECTLAIADDDVLIPSGITRIDPDAGTSDAWHAGPATPDDLAYVIFTSGSTGTPKGVMIRHRAAANTIRDINSRFSCGSEDRVLALSSLNFDLSVWDIFGTLSSGGAIVIPEAESVRDPEYLAAAVERHGVTVWNSVPSYLQMVAEYGPDPSRLASLRLAMLSGDWIPVTLPGRLAVPIVSLGGATEASIWSIAFAIDRVDPSWKSIPYGKPLANQTFHVLDDHLQDCPDGVAGELYIGGDGVADGYWRAPELTAASFIDHPRAGARLYRTGDWGRYLPDGNIEFLGRRDGQVKISGFRVELGEVEAAVTRCAGVREAAAVTFSDEYGQNRLSVFFTGDTSPREVRAYLQSALPAYMVPARLTAIDALPLSSNGKVDRKALAARATGAGQSQEIDRLFAPDVLQDPQSRRSFIAEERAIRRDLKGRSLPFRAADDLPIRAAQFTSVRDFSGTPRLEQIEALLSGLRAFDCSGRPRRAYPSAGETWSVQTYVHIRTGRVDGIDGGIYYHHPLRNELIAIGSPDAVDHRVHVPGNQRMVDEASFWIAFFADLSAIRPLYGDFAERFAWMEAGHMAQILRETAPAIGLGLCLVGAYDSEPVKRNLQLSDDHVPVASMVGGIPRTVAVGMSVTDRARLALAARGKRDLPAATQHLATAIAAIWREVLAVDEVGYDDRFFEVGGTSFAMLNVQRELQSRLERKVSITDLFSHATIAELAAHLAAEPATDTPGTSPTRTRDELADKRLARKLRRAGLEDAQS